MRIAFFVHRFPSVSETFVLRQITGLLDLGHDVDIYSERRPAGEHYEPLHRELNAYRLLDRVMYLDGEMPVESGYWSMPVWPFSGQTWLPGAEEPISNSDRLLQAVPVLRDCLAAAPELTVSVLDPDQFGNQALSLEALYHLHSLLQRPGDYDVLHAHFGPVGNSFRFARRLWQAPLVVTFHGYDFSMTPRLQGPEVYRDLFREADMVLGVSEYANVKLQELGCPTEKLRVMHTGVHPAEFQFRPRHFENGEPVRILTVGRLVEKKGIEYALRAVALARRTYPNLRYEIIGDGPLRPALASLIRELDLGAVACLLGAADNDFVRQKMAEAHLFLLPSVTAADGDQEGIPVSLMEAQASGLPVLSTTHSGISEVVADDESGFLVPERDAEMLASRLCDLIQNSQRWPQLGRAGRHIIESQFNIQTLNRELVGLYEQVSRQFREPSHLYGESTVRA